MPAVARTGDQRLDLRGLLDAVEASPPIDAVDVLADELRRMVDARHVSLLITDNSGGAVRRLSHVAPERDGRDGLNERAQSLGLPGSAYERVLSSQKVEIAPEHDGWLVLVPVTERGDAIGLLELSLLDHPDDETLDYLHATAHALAYVLVASRRHTDLFEWAQRNIPFSLAAEIQRRLLPSAYTIEGGPFTLAGWLEPASDVAGDTFDYSIDREFLYASITDAMGHSTEAALLATLTVGSFRNSRRALASPSEQADAANEALLTGTRADQFVTGQLLRIHLDDGHVEFVNAGHPPPFLVRAGQVRQLDVMTQPVLGVTTGAYGTQELDLAPGDRLLLLTDGFLERRAGRLDLPAVLAASAARHPREVVRELATRVLNLTGGSLSDDATVLCIDWYGRGEHRNAIGGASLARATGV